MRRKSMAWQSDAHLDFGPSGRGDSAEQVASNKRSACTGVEEAPGDFVGTAGKNQGQEC